MLLSVDVPTSQKFRVGYGPCLKLPIVVRMPQLALLLPSLVVLSQPGRFPG